MSVIYVDSWCRRSPSHDATVQTLALARSLRSLQRDLQAAGFTIAGDLVAAASIALWQKAQTDPGLD